MSCARHSKWLLAGVLFLIGVLVAEDALAQRGGRGGGGGRGGQGRNRNEREQETYSIVRVGDEIQAVLKDTVEDVAKSVKRENTEELKAWTQAKKDASANKEDFDDPKPKPKPFKVLVKSVDGRRDAEELREKYQEKLLASLKGTYSVIRIDGEYRVVKKSEVASMRKDLDKKYQKELAEFRKSGGGRGNEGGGGRGGADRPQRPDLEIVPKAFSTEKEAFAYAAELEKKSPTGSADGRRGGNRGERGGRGGKGDDTAGE